MMRLMKQRLLSLCLAAVLPMMLFCTAPLALAQDDAPKPDAKLANYPPQANLGEGSIALTWILFIFLMVIAMGTMTKNAKRSHLD